MFSSCSLFSQFYRDQNKLTDDGKRRLRVAAEKRKSNPDFVELNYNWHPPLNSAVNQTLPQKWVYIISHDIVCIGWYYVGLLHMNVVCSVYKLVCVFVSRLNFVSALPVLGGGLWVWSSLCVHSLGLCAVVTCSAVCSVFTHAKAVWWVKVHIPSTGITFTCLKVRQTRRGSYYPARQLHHGTFHTHHDPICTALLWLIYNWPLNVH